MLQMMITCLDQNTCSGTRCEGWFAYHTATTYLQSIGATMRSTLALAPSLHFALSIDIFAPARRLSSFIIKEATLLGCDTGGRDDGRQTMILEGWQYNAVRQCIWKLGSTRQYFNRAYQFEQAVVSTPSSSSKVHQDWDTPYSLAMEPHKQRQS